MDDVVRRIGNYSIWLFAAGYFASYVPYSALTKAVSSGRIGGTPISGGELLPASAIASLVGMFAFISAMGWWKHASTVQLGPLRLPRPGRYTLLSGICTAGIIATTTLAYTFDGVSIVFMMLLMRGGVLILAALVDRLAGRQVRWFSTVGLVLSIYAMRYLMPPLWRLRARQSHQKTATHALYLVTTSMCMTCSRQKKMVQR